METLSFKKIGIEDKELFDRYFKDYPPKASELTFTNLFVYRESRPIEFAVFEEHMIITFLDTKNKRSFFSPIGNAPSRMIEKILEMYPNAAFERIEKSIVKDTNIELSSVHDKDNDDYVYDIKELIELQGQRYSSKRNFVNRFEKNSPIVKDIDDVFIKDCLHLNGKWCDLKDCTGDASLKAEFMAIKQALLNFKRLSLISVAVFVDGKISGFAIGERLNEDTFVEHFEKANPELGGAYQYILNSFAKKIPSNFLYLNREQDLGNEGLRKSKESYHPKMMIEKYRISR